MTMNRLQTYRIRRFFLLWSLLVAIAAGALTADRACAHKVNAFAYVQGDKVIVEAYFSGNVRMRDGKVQVFDAVGNMFKEGRTDENGEFSFPVADISKDAGDVRILVDAEMGHQAEYILSAADIPGRAAQVSVPQPPEKSSSAKPGPKEISAPLADMGKLLDDKLQPLITMLGTQQKLLLAEKNNGPSFREIVGGLGWIMGIFGLWSYMSSRNKHKE